LKISSDLADLAVTLTDNTATGMTTAGSQVTYTIVVTNNGPLSVTGAAIEDTFPAELSNVSWTTTASAGSSVAPSSGNGDISSLANLPNGGTVTFFVTATLSGSLQIGDSVVNVATVSVPVGRADPDQTNNLATDTITIRPQRNFIVFVADGLRGDAVDAFLQPTDALRQLMDNGVSFADSHSIFPTFTTP